MDNSLLYNYYGKTQDAHHSYVEFHTSELYLYG